jgi:sulfate adenylyltransferase subunit 2
MKYNLTNLQKLENESIFILREIVASFKNPIILFSIGKDSCVMLHLASKAFHPLKIPFSLMHIDTQWKFQDMYKFKKEISNIYNVDMITYTNPKGRNKITPFNTEADKYTYIMKTEALRQSLDLYKIDAAICGARRDEEKSRAKERVFSFRDSNHHWNPKCQRPELWNLYNTRINDKESIRAFPLSNWTEIDIWHYILKEQIPIVPLYLAKERKVIERDNTLILVDDDRLNISETEKVVSKKIRFRTLGCYPLSGGIPSNAECVEDIIEELVKSSTSERQGRLIDFQRNSSMEDKKREGYF